MMMMMMMVKAIEVCWQLIICNEICFRHVHLFVLLLEFIYTYRSLIWSVRVFPLAASVWRLKSYWK